jgi:phytoene dehydrogenase-like protein
MVRCTVDGCGVIVERSKHEAEDLGWRFIMLESSAGVKYRVYCPAHDVGAIVDDLRATLKGLGGTLLATTHVIHNLPPGAVAAGKGKKP